MNILLLLIPVFVGLFLIYIVYKCFIKDEFKKISIRKIRKETSLGQEYINQMINTCKKTISDMQGNSKVRFHFNRSADYNGGYFPFTKGITTTTPWLRDLLIAPEGSTCFDEWKITIAHEIAHYNHKDFNHFFLSYHSPTNSMFAILKEVRADIEGRNIAGFDKDYAKILSQNKIKRFEDINFIIPENKVQFFSHPYWSDRIIYINQFDSFDRNVVEQVISDYENKLKHWDKINKEKIYKILK